MRTDRTTLIADCQERRLRCLVNARFDLLFLGGVAADWSSEELPPSSCRDERVADEFENDTLRFLLLRLCSRLFSRRLYSLVLASGVKRLYSVSIIIKPIFNFISINHSVGAATTFATFLTLFFIFFMLLPIIIAEIGTLSAKRLLHLLSLGAIFLLLPPGALIC